MKVWAGWLGLAMVLTVVLAGCSSSSTAVTISISPGSGTVLLGTSFQFVPAVAGSQNGVQWSVNGIPNGNATVGTIDASGLYTAPTTLPTPPSGAIVPVLLSLPNATIPNSGTTGSLIELQNGADLGSFVAGNTITISGNSTADWNGSFVIVSAALLSNGNYGVQIATPPTAPAAGQGGTATVAPGITITAQVESTSAVATATLTLDSGIRVTLSQLSFTIGTNEQYLFGPTATVTGTANQAVTWSLSGVGTLNPTSGLYVAPSVTGSATVTATSVVDSTQSASATVSVITAVDPTISSISPSSGALGAAFQDVFITGNNFISTTNVFVNGSPLPTKAIFSTNSSTLFVVVPDSVLSTLPTPPATTVPLTFTVARQTGAQQACSPLPCQVLLSPVRPALVAIKPDSIPQASVAQPPVTLDGGYFGTLNTTLGFSGNKLVNVQFSGLPVPTLTFNSDRQLQFSVPAGSITGPGLYPVTLTNVASGSANGSMVGANIAVQPSAGPTQIGLPITVGTSASAAPSSVAINTATGVAIVSNPGSNDITLINMPNAPGQSASILMQSLCTGSIGSASGPGCGAAAPISVAVDNVRNLALVANSSTANLAVVNLSGVPQVTALISFPSADSAGNPFPLVPRAVGINPVSGRALVAFTASTVAGSNAGAILDMNQLQAALGVVSLPAAVINVVNINNGLNPRIAVSPKLNWALATPGGVGALSIVDLGRRTINVLSAISCAPATSTAPTTVSANTTTVNGLQVGQPVLITGVNPPTFNGIFSVTAVNNTSFQYYAKAPCVSSAASGSGGIASDATPVASVGVDFNVRGVSINDETQKALLVDPTQFGPAFVFNILDQTAPFIIGLPAPGISNVASAMNPLTNIGVIVNEGGQAYVVDPATPTVLATFSTGVSPVDVAIDPATNVAIIVNNGANSVSLFSLGTSSQQLRNGAPQIVQSSVAPVGSSQTSSQVVISSSLGSPAAAPNQTITLIGHFTGSSVPRLDGSSSAFTNVSILNGGREMTATLSGAALAANGPRQYAVDAMDTSAGTSNVARLQAIQAVSLLTGDCSGPAPQGVAINGLLNVAIVTEPGCNAVSLVNLATGTGFGPSPELPVQANPQGVDVYPQAGLAVVANTGSNSVSIVDMAHDDVATTFTTDPLPSGVAVDVGNGNVLVTANGASVVDTFPVSTSPQTPSTIAVQQSPSGVAVDPLRSVAVVANSASGSNNASVLNLSTGATTFTTPSSGIIFPQGVAFDPITDTFMITSSASNQIVLLNPVTGAVSMIRVGIDPSSIAYNPASGTLVTANNLSSTISVVDFLDDTVRGVFSLPSSSQFAVAIQPRTNLAVIADPADNELLLVPLPH